MSTFGGYNQGVLYPYIKMKFKNLFNWFKYLLLGILMSKPEFTPDVKRKVRLKSRNLCARCRQTPVEVHHIDKTLKRPQLNQIDNAVTLCDKHHDIYNAFTTGAENAGKRGEVKLLRDMLYEDLEDPQYQTLIVRMDSMEESQKKQNWLIVEFFQMAKNTETPEDFQKKIADGISTGTFHSIFDSLHSCPKCATKISRGDNYCRNCGANL